GLVACSGWVGGEGAAGAPVGVGVVGVEGEVVDVEAGVEGGEFVVDGVEGGGGDVVGDGDVGVVREAEFVVEGAGVDGGGEEFAFADAGDYGYEDDLGDRAERTGAAQVQAEGAGGGGAGGEVGFERGEVGGGYV